MGNKGWDTQLSGGEWGSNQRTTGRDSGVDGADAFVKGSRIADPGMHNDPMDGRGDLFEPPGQMSTC